jgi:hypothetical protein
MRLDGILADAGLIAGAVWWKLRPRNRNAAVNKPKSTAKGRRIHWQNVMTVVSAAILIGAEVFGAAFAGGWAVANLFDLGPLGVHIMQGLFFAAGVAVMVSFLRNAKRVEPFTTAG